MKKTTKKENQPPMELKGETYSLTHTPELTGTSAQMRNTFIHWYLRPVLQAMFDLEPRLQGAYVAFAQYWNDEADDAVHCHVQPLADPRLTWSEAFTEKNSLFYRDEEPDNEEEAETYVSAYELEHKAIEKVYGKEHYGRTYDNDELVTAFASYTEEESSQESATEEAYTPYLYVWRDGRGVSYAVVGTMHRPHLEDQLSDWAKEESRQDGQLQSRVGP